MENSLGLVGVIGRFRPLHLGAALMLGTVCEQADYVIIGIGSSNKYNARNPFTPTEVRKMINKTLSPYYHNYSLIDVPDFAHLPQYSNGKKWKDYVVEHFGALDHFVSGNDYIRNLLQPEYNLVAPAELIPRERWIWMKGSIVRMEMARDGDWKSLVPCAVAEYLIQEKLVEQFQKEFGLETLSSLVSGPDYCAREDGYAEAQHAMEK